MSSRTARPSGASGKINYGFRAAGLEGDVFETTDPVDGGEVFATFTGARAALAEWHVSRCYMDACTTARKLRKSDVRGELSDLADPGEFWPHGPRAERRTPAGRPTSPDNQSCTSTEHWDSRGASSCPTGAPLFEGPDSVMTVQSAAYGLLRRTTLAGEHGEFTVEEDIAAELEVGPDTRCGRSAAA